MNARPRRLAGDLYRPAAGQRGLAIGGNRELQRHVRAAVENPADMARVVAPRLVRAEPVGHGNPRRAQTGITVAGDLGIGIAQRRDHARDPGGNNGVDAGGRPAVMRAGLERDIERGVPRLLSRAPQRLGLGMRPAASLSPAAADNAAVLDDNRTDRRIGPGIAEPASPERQRELHETEIGGCGTH